MAIMSFQATEYMEMVGDRVNEAIVRYKGFKNMKVLLGGMLYVIKPLIVGLIPQKIFKVIKKYQYKTK